MTVETDATEYTDASGTAFDAEVHAMKDGEPIVTASGNFRKKKKSLHKLTDDPVVNVKVNAGHKVDLALAAINKVGGCHTSNFQWSEEQIEKVKQHLSDATAAALDNIRVGKKIAAAGIQL